MKIPGGKPYLKLPAYWKVAVRKGMDRESPRPPISRERDDFVAFLKIPECEVAAQYYFAAVQKSYSRISFIPVASYFAMLVRRCLYIRAEADAVKAITPEMVEAIQKATLILGDLYARTESYGHTLYTLSGMSHDPDLPELNDGDVCAGLLTASHVLRNLARKKGTAGRPKEVFEHGLIHILAKDLRGFLKEPCAPAIAALLNATFPDGTRFTAPYVAKILSTKKGRFTSKDSPDSG